MEYGSIESHSVMCRLTTVSQKWSNLQDVAAASTVFHKYTTQLLGHANVGSSLKIDYAFEFDMDLLDIKGAQTQIKLASANELNVGLGFSLAPDGNQQHEYARRREKIQHICKAAVAMHLRQHKAFILMKCRLISQTTYGVRLSQFNKKQCHSLDALVLGVFIPLLKVNRSTPRAHGCMGHCNMEAWIFSNILSYRTNGIFTTACSPCDGMILYLMISLQH